MKLPCISWVLTASVKPVIALIVEQFENENMGRWYVSESGRLYRADRVYQTLKEATAAAFARLDKDQASAHRTMVIANKHRAALEAANK
jgi:hypothetical protein